MLGTRETILHDQERELSDRDRQIAAGGIADRQVVEPGVMGGRRRGAFALPGVESDVVVIAAGREEHHAPLAAHQERIRIDIFLRNTHP